MTDKRRAAAKARDEWLDSEEGRKWRRLIAAGAAKESALMAAFDAGCRGGRAGQVLIRGTEETVDWKREGERLAGLLAELPTVDRIAALNDLRSGLHEASPFKDEPVDCVLWVPSDEVIANNYNPNQVAPPEMRLLERSIQEDGYTQPIVTWSVNGHYEVVDGFHRNRVGRESDLVRDRILGYLPVTRINQSRAKRGDRIAATIRHNRARGKHQIGRMAEIVLELKRRNWSDKKIGKELGMDPDEVLRLSQITGLAEMFADKEFSEAWEADSSIINETDTLDVGEEGP